MTLLARLAQANGPGRIDLAQVLLDDLRARLTAALVRDTVGHCATATEVRHRMEQPTIAILRARGIE